MIELIVSLVVVLISMLLMHRWYKQKVNQVSQSTHDFTSQIEQLKRQTEATRVKSIFDKLSALLIASDPHAYYHVLLSIESNTQQDCAPEQVQHINEIMTFFTQHPHIHYGLEWDVVFAHQSLHETLVNLWLYGKHIELGESHLFVHNKELKIAEMIDPRLIEHCHKLSLCAENDITSVSSQYFYRTYAITRINTIVSALATINACVYQHLISHSELPQAEGTFANGCFERITLDHTDDTQIIFKVYLNSLREEKDKNCSIRFHRVYDGMKQQYRHFTQYYMLVDGQYQPLLSDCLNIHQGVTQRFDGMLDNGAIKAFQITSDPTQE